MAMAAMAAAAALGGGSGGGGTALEEATPRGGRDYVFIINPASANGRAARQWKKIVPLLKKALGNDCNVVEQFTRHEKDATEMARKAVMDRAHAVVAVGGDGTLNQIVNGFFLDGEPVAPSGGEGDGVRTACGLIPLGTGCDFPRTFGWKSNDIKGAVERISRGKTKRLDVGRARCAGLNAARMFVNVLDMHLSARTGQVASKFKFLGPLCYVVGAVLAFLQHVNRDVILRVDGEQGVLVKAMSALVVANGAYFGGGMKIAPTADPFSGKLDIVTLIGFKLLDFILKGWHLFAGSHYNLKGVTHRRVARLEVGDPSMGPSTIEVEADGEFLGHLPLAVDVLPGAVDFLC